ncbi:MAG: ArsR/SmtB family transcription factor [Candidatus Spyradocola sp.]|jgi:ArsR family transcriptional regulator
MVEMDAACICKALSDSNRLRIVRSLLGGEMCACKLLEQFSITQPTLSHHMKVLCECELVRVRREGKWSWYSLNEETLTAFRDFIDGLAGGAAAPQAETERR